MVPASRTTVNGSEQSVLLLLTANKLYILDCDTNTLQQHFSIKHSKLEKQDTSHKGLVELHLMPHLRSADMDALPQTNFQAVEYYLELSQMEAQELPVFASGNSDNTVASDNDKDNNIVLLISEQEATRLLSVFQSIRSHILEPELGFCVYSSPVDTTKAESFFSVGSQPTV